MICMTNPSDRDELKDYKISWLEGGNSNFVSCFPYFERVRW